jgi:two-component system chemotaxis response regulator CheY
MAVLGIQDLSILLVEPSSTQQKIIVQALTQQGITKLDSVTNGQKALAYSEKYHPDLMISAMHLPDMTAVQLIQAIRNDQDTENMNFMMISSETSFELVDGVKQAGAIAVLPKPFDHNDLKRALFAASDSMNEDILELDNLETDDLCALIVDDSKLARKHISRLLKGLDINNILEAENGKEAISRLADNPVDFIVSDYNMPEMNGEELLNFLKSSEYSYIPVIMVTSESETSRLSAIRQAGVCALFDKTIDTSSLKHILQNTLN